MDVVGNVALNKEVTKNNQGYPVHFDLNQVNYICDQFRYAVTTNEDDIAVSSPLVIKKSNFQFFSGYADIIEIHGSFTRTDAELAISKLKSDTKAPLGPKDIVELVMGEEGMAKAIRFIIPRIWIKP